MKGGRSVQFNILFIYSLFESTEGSRTPAWRGSVYLKWTLSGPMVRGSFLIIETAVDNKFTIKKRIKFDFMTLSKPKHSYKTAIIKEK